MSKDKRQRDGSESSHNPAAASAARLDDGTQVPVSGGSSQDLDEDDDDDNDSDLERESDFLSKASEEDGMHAEVARSVHAQDGVSRMISDFLRLRPLKPLTVCLDDLFGDEEQLLILDQVH